MLQFVTKPSATLPIDEQARLAIAGGCGWIQLRNNYPSAAELRQAAEQIIPVCRDNDVILTIEDDVDLVTDLRVHGIHLSDPTKAAAVREQFGPHAIIGVDVTTADELIALRTVDVDYATLRVNPVADPAHCSEIICRAREAGVKLPIVATGITATEQVSELLPIGFQGVAVSDLIADAPSPAEVTHTILAALI